MANQFKPVIDQLKDQSDKDGSKDLLYQEYKKYTAPQLAALRDEDDGVQGESGISLSPLVM